MTVASARRPGRPLKGALHTHTRASDGSIEPSELAELYRELGFDFVFVTDHHKVTCAGGPPGLLVLPGIEVGFTTPARAGSRQATPDQYWHFVGLGVEPMTEPTGVSPEVLYEFLRSKAAFSMVAHPYWSQISGRDLLRFPGVACVEVWNSGCEIELLRGRGEYAWDWALSAGARMLGAAVDDCHGYDDVGHGWVMVDAESLTADAILDALSSGAFFSSCGPDIRVRREGDVIFAETSPCRSIAFVADRQCGRRVLAETGQALERAEYVLKGRERYVRAECTDAEGRKAWSNPIYIEPAKPAGA